MLAEVLDGANVSGLSQRRHIAEAHVVDHALPQRRSLFWHGMLLSVELHKRAILTDARTTGRRLPRHSQSHKVREIYVVRSIGNGSVKPYSPNALAACGSPCRKRC